MSASDITMLFSATVLALYLCLRVQRRLVTRLEERLRARTGAHAGKALDTTPLHKRVRCVRQNYAAVAHTRPCDERNRKSLIALATRALFSLGYFRNRSSACVTEIRDRTTVIKDA